MPGTSKARNKKGVIITFTESDHRYTSIINGKEINYISGTTFISKFFPKFDPTGEITKRYAFKHGLSVETVKQLWKEKADNSCIYGTKIHECMEDRLSGQELRNKPENDKEIKAMKNAEILSHKIIERAKIEGIEKIVFDPELQLAGSIDLLIKSKKDNKFWICDYKTNEKIVTENKYNKFGLYCIDHIPDVTAEHYYLQLNLYEYLLKKGEYIDKNEDIGKCLFHITENGVKTMIVPDRQKEVKEMIKFYLENKTLFN